MQHAQQLFLRGLAFIVLVFFGNLFASPGIIAATQAKTCQPLAQTDHMFANADPAVYRLVQKIACFMPVTLEEVKGLPKGALNRRYDDEMTLLFHALANFNLQAIDMLLAAGADPYMVDHPSRNSAQDLTYYMAKAYSRFDISEDFKTELLRLYLKHGGDPNHRLLSGESFFEIIVEKENYDAIDVLLQAGADPLAYNFQGTSSPVLKLTAQRNRTARRLLQRIVCHGAFDHAQTKAVEDIIHAFAPGGWEGTEREMLHKKLTIRILKYHPDFKDNADTQKRFNGPIPWKEILEANEGELCK